MNTERRSSMRVLVAALAALPLIAAPLAAQPAVVHTLAMSPVGTSSTVEATAARERVDMQRERANRLTLSGNWEAAGSAWSRVARMQRAQGELPVEALWTRAEMYHVQGFRVEAASVLTKLAAEAEAADRPDVSATAFLEAAILYHSSKRHQQARLSMEQVDRILRSHELDPELREALERRIR
jgi:hypothetical protein